MIRAVIFDLDGTLLDTSQDIHSVLNTSLAKFSLPLLTMEKTMEFVGDGAKKLIERAVAPRFELTEEVYLDYMDRFVHCNNSHTKLYEGERETLKNLAAQGLRFAIISNKPQEATDRVYDSFLKDFHFCEVLGQTEYYPLKPDPASTLAVMARLGVSREQCVYVGDGDADVLTAKNAGIPCISALWGFRRKDQLIKAGADLFAESFAELEKILRTAYNFT